MAAGRSKDANDDGTKRKKEDTRSRGTTDELEIMKLVILENPVLMQRILEKIRFVRAESKAAQAYSNSRKEAAEKAKGKKAG